MLVEYKPFEPAFYHTDIADWGMALELSRGAGPQAKVLVDTGHHYQGTNIEQIVAWLLELGRLGGFHFNDRKYADDDLTIGSIDPYQVFRIFHEIHFECAVRGAKDAGIHDRPEPQPEGQGGSDGAERRDGAGAVCEGCAGGPAEARRVAGCVPAGGGGRGVPRGVLAGCSTVAAGMAGAEGLAAGPDGGAARERICGENFGRARC